MFGLASVICQAWLCTTLRHQADVPEVPALCVSAQRISPRLCLLQGDEHLDDASWVRAVLCCLLSLQHLIGQSSLTLSVYHPPLWLLLDVADCSTCSCS